MQRREEDEEDEEDEAAAIAAAAAAAAAVAAAAAAAAAEEATDIVPPAFPSQVYHRRQPMQGPSTHERALVTPSLPVHQSSRWKNFLEGTATYPPNTSHSDKERDEWLAAQPDLNEPWLASLRDPENGEVDAAEDHRELHGKTKRRIWYKQIHVGSLPVMTRRVC